LTIGATKVLAQELLLGPSAANSTLGVNDRCTGTVEQPRFRRSRRDIRRRSCRRSFGDARIAAVDGIQPKKS
jgi:hypothetical protein